VIALSHNEGMLTEIKTTFPGDERMKIAEMVLEKFDLGRACELAAMYAQVGTSNDIQ
jgi:hypothetical protein